MPRVGRRRSPTPSRHRDNRHRSRPQSSRPTTQPLPNDAPSPSLRFGTRFAATLTAPGGAVLLLRAFLGVTFSFAGLQKLANPRFFRATSPSGIQAQLAGSMRSSPIRPLLHLVAHAPVEFGIAIAVGEVAIGIGTLFGLFGRVAAAGGMLLSLSFFLSISFATSPYYYGSDIVFVFAWTVLLLGGSGLYSLDSVLERNELAQAVPRGREISRRSVLARGGAIALGAAATGLLAGFDAIIGRALGHSVAASGVGTTRGTTTTTAAGSSGSGSSGTTAGSSGTTAGSSGSGSSGRVSVLATSAVAIGGAAMFTDPGDGQPAYALQPQTGHFLGFSAVCTHAGCTVGYNESTDTFNCPCHGSIYNASTGAVIQGPAPLPLPSIPLTASGGQLYIEG